MKKVNLLIILMLSLLLCMGQSLLEEGTSSFIKLSKVWIVALEPCYDAQNQPTTSIYYKFIGDTLVGGMGYTKMYTSVKIDRSDWKLDSYWREDESGKIFIRRPGENEKLIYNFNLIVGDTIKNEVKELNAVVDSISIKPFGSENRKYLYSHQVLNPTHILTWIEGVGSLIAPTIYNGTYITGGTFILSCFEEDGQLIYHNPKFTTCFAEGIENNQQTEFAPIGAEWYYSQYVSYNPPMANYIKQTCIKDSIIASKRVKVIQKTKFKYGGVPVNLGYEYLHQNGDTIFYWKSGAFHELYNFSLSKGDSMLLYSEMPNYCEDKTPYGWIGIDSVYSTKINNHQLKAYFSTHKECSVWGFDSFPIIEKIGSTEYLLPQNAFCGIVDGEPGIGRLRCYFDPELGMVHFENTPCDTITTYPDGISLVDKSPMVKIYPNPVSEKLFIEGNFPEKGVGLELYSVTGELVKTECLEGGTNIYRMDISSLKSGIYILHLISSSGNYAEEVIIKK